MLPTLIFARMMVRVPMRHRTTTARWLDDGVAAGEAIGADVARAVDGVIDAEERFGDGSEAGERARLADVEAM